MRNKMNELQYYLCSNTDRLFRFLESLLLTERKWWLIYFNYRHIALSFAESATPDVTDDEELRERELKHNTVRVGFDFVDGKATFREVRIARWPHRSSFHGPEAHDSGYDHVRQVFCAESKAWLPGVEMNVCDMTRSIVGNPFHVVSLPSLACWLTPTIKEISRNIYEDRDWTLIPILADALVDSGFPETPGRTASEIIKLRTVGAIYGGCCDYFADNKGCDCLSNAHPDSILDHFRSGGPFYKGDWALDMILGKE